jgi:hypothetical protein
MAAAEKAFEAKIADLVRLLGSEYEGEILAAQSALKRLLASQDVGFNDLGNAIEKLASGGLAEAEMKRLFDAGYQKGVEDAERRRVEAQTVLGLHADGSPDWEAVALRCQREKSRIETKHHEFIDDMASRMTWGREPTERQGKYLLSIFRGIGGRIR